VTLQLHCRPRQKLITVGMGLINVCHAVLSIRFKTSVFGWLFETCFFLIRLNLVPSLISDVRFFHFTPRFEIVYTSPLNQSFSTCNVIRHKINWTWCGAQNLHDSCVLCRCQKQLILEQINTRITSIQRCKLYTGTVVKYKLKQNTSSFSEDSDFN